MQQLEMPRALRGKGITNWPKIMLVGKNEKPPVGMPFIRATPDMYVLTFRLLMPTLKKKYPFFNWSHVFYELTGRKYKPLEFEYEREPYNEGTGHSYGESCKGGELRSLEELAADLSVSVDIDVLAELNMIPKFFGDLRSVIQHNVTTEYLWNDGFNKKTGVCTGYLEEQPRKKSLVIIDISASIPSGVSTGMLTLMQTMADITNADVIITGGESLFFEHDEAMVADARMIRRTVSCNNESKMFRKILDENVMDYDVVISFGDSDNPGEISLPYAIHTKKLYDFFTGERDWYGRSYTTGTGYARWVTENNPDVEVVSYTDWVAFFKE